MIINNFPVDVKYLLKNLGVWASFYSKTRSYDASKPGKVNFLYFSYQPDFDYLSLSIQSVLSTLPADKLGLVFIAEDQKAPFDREQKEALLAMYAGIRIQPIYNFEWGSAQSTYEEIQLFMQLSAELECPEDIIAKIDSDVLLFSPDKFLKILGSDIQAVGDPHFLQYQYAQGGLYLLRKQLIDEVFGRIELNDIETVNHENGSVGEDKAITRLLQKANKPFCFTRLMLFPDEYNNIDHLTSLTKWDFVGLHFHKEKEKMAAVAAKLSL